MDTFYLSQLVGRPVYTGRGERVARVKDLVARLEAFNTRGEIALEAYPPISGLVVDIARREIFIPWSKVKSLGPDGARLSSAKIDLRHFERREGEVLLSRDMLDKQLIDIDGKRVVRANDLQLYSRDGVVRVAAVDVGPGALLRRLTFGRMFARVAPGRPEQDRGGDKLLHHKRNPASVINWADIEPLRAGVPDVRLRLSHERLAKLHPVEIAHIADELSYIEGAEIIQSLDDETAAETLQEMDEDRQADIVEGMDQERAADILEEMDPDDAADLLADLEEIQAEDLLRRMDPEDAEDVKELLAYEENTAGGLMTSDFVTVPPWISVDDIINFMRRLEDAPDVIDYLYVVEEEHPTTDWEQFQLQEPGKVLGIVTLRDLLLSTGDRCMADLMSTDFVSVGPQEPADRASRTMAEYNLIALPVLDENEHLLGIITVDDAMEVLLPEKWLHRLPRVFS